MAIPYMPGPAAGAQVQKDGDNWTLILVRELNHPRERVWEALTDPEHLREWAPFDVDGNLGHAGTTVQLSVANAPRPMWLAALPDPGNVAPGYPAPRG